MQTTLAPHFRNDPAAQEAAAIVRNCVHCGFCTATCPTYQLLGDELDGPRGRIHLIKQMLEGEQASASTRLHLDRCLTCRACETTCPSGVEYGRLLDTGRAIVEKQVPRSPWQRLARRLLAAVLTGPAFAPLLALGQRLRPILPSKLAARIPPRQVAGPWPGEVRGRQVLLLRGCVQSAIAPDIDAATARVLDRLGVSARFAQDSGCCGALRHHLGDSERALVEARRNIDAWWPHVEAGVDAIVSTASGCGVQLREYGHLLRLDPAYAARAARIASLVRDPAELLASHAARLRALLHRAVPQRVAFQAPCSLQHGLRIRGSVESLLATLGAELTPVQDAHLCCGSAGTYSLLQPGISRQLGRARAKALQAGGPEVILSANIGCMTQLGAHAEVPVQHWIEWVDGRMGVPSTCSGAPL
jgi:glycolate oxidase iron-sulfur subunit